MGLIIVCSGLFNLLTLDLFLFSLHRGLTLEAEAFLAVTLPQHTMERVVGSRFYHLRESLTTAGLWYVVNWWLPPAGMTGTGWKWRNRQWAIPANWAARQAELLVLWGIVLFRPQLLGTGRAMCPAEGWTYPPLALPQQPGPAPPFSPAAPAAAPLAAPAAPPPGAPLSAAQSHIAGGEAVLLRYGACGGCCRGPIVFREGALADLFLFSVSAVCAAHLASSGSTATSRPSRPRTTKATRSSALGGAGAACATPRRGRFAATGRSRGVSSPSSAD